MSIQNNKKDNLIEEIQEDIIPEKNKRIASQKTLDALALGRKKRQDALLLKRQEREKQMELNKKVRKVNKILKQHFSEAEIPDNVLKPVLKKKEPEIEEKEVKEEIKKQKTEKTKKKYIKSKKPLQRIRLEIHNDTSSSEEEESDEEIEIPKKQKSKKVVEKKEELETIKETPVDYYSDSGMLYKHPHDLFGRPIKRF